MEKKKEKSELEGRKYWKEKAEKLQKEDRIKNILKMSTREDLIRFIYYIYNYRLLYYLPMERMKKEEKNLKEDNEKLAKGNYDELQRLGLENYELREENKKLNIKVASLEGEIKGLNSVIEKLHKEIEEQEAEGGGLFDEIDYRKREAKRLGWKPNK